MESTLINLVIQALAGAAGGAGAGKTLPDLSMGKPVDAIAGAIGGGVVGSILATAFGAADAAGIDIATLARDIVGGGVGGAAVVAIIGAIRNAVAR
ncbi:MAG: hypothetical protein ACOYB4_10780 [Methyloceanibacter sp.]